MIRRVMVAGALVTATLTLSSAPAHAGEAPDYAGCRITVDPSTFDAGDTVSVIGDGLQPDFETTISFDDDELGTATTDSLGHFETTVVIPEDAGPGDHTISALCDASGNVGQTDVSISGEQGEQEGRGPLAFTGSDVEPLVVFGAVAVLAGIAFLLAARRRRRSSVSV